MRRIQKIILFLVCICLLINCAGCFDTGNDPETMGTQATSPSESTAPEQTEPTQTDPQLSDSYNMALEALRATDALSMTVTVSKEMVLGSETITSHSHQEITWLGLGTDDLRANVEEIANFGDYETEITELFADGKLYSNVYGSDFVCEMTAEEFSTRYVPVAALNTSLYTSCTEESQDGVTVVHFWDATQPESWLAAEEAEWISGEAEAMVSADGQLQSIQYNAIYRYAGAQVTSTITVEYAAPAVSFIKAPADLKNYITLTDANAPRLIEQIYGYLTGFESLSFSSNVTTYVEAAGLYMAESYIINTYGAGKNLQAKVDSSIYVMDGYSNETYEYTLEELFLNGKYTASTDGGTPESNRSVTADVMSNYVLTCLTEYVLDWSCFSAVTCTDLGSLLLYEFTGNEELATTIDSEVCYDVFNNENLLSDMASSYQADPVEYYIAVDKYLGLPTAMGLYYKGTYTIDGYQYASTRQVDQSIYLASLDSYEAIHNVSAPDVEPENTATPLFYHVTGPDGQEMWLLGTIHVGDNRTGYLPQEIYDAYTAADALAVECNTRAFEEQAKNDPEIQEAVSHTYYYSDSTTAEDHVSDSELYKAALQMMKATGNYFFNAPYLKVAGWAISIDNFFLRQCYTLSSDKGVDNRLLMMAEADGKTILEVESCLFQLKMLTGWSDALSEDLLASAVSTHTLEYAAQLQELYEMWCAGDEATLIAYLNEDPGELTAEEQALYDEYNKAMSLDRDIGMVKTAINYLESGDTVFYAVGLAHVLSEDGLVNSLREAGYTVELVEFN